MSKPSRKATAAERQIKLALYACAHGPVSRTQVQNHLAEYATPATADPAARKREEATARRRFERDKAALSRFGIELEVDEGGLYRLSPADNGAFSSLEEGSVQSALLRVASAALLQDPSFEHAGDLRMALAKLSGPLEIPDVLPWAEQEALRGLRPAEPSVEGTRRKAKTALETRKLLRFEYTDAAGRITQREIEPIGLYASNGYEYLAAWDSLRAAERCFRLDRMGRVNVKDSGRGKPDFEPRTFDPARWQLLPFQIGAKASEATVRIAPSALWQARNLCSAHGSIVKEPIGTCFWRVSCASPAGLAAWCIANGPGLVPTSPQEATGAYWRLVEEASTWGEDGNQTATAAQRDETHVCRAEEEDPSADEVFFEEEQQEDPFGLELACFADGLAAQYATSEPDCGSAKSTLTDDDLLFAMLALAEQAGAVSIPQAAQFLGVSEAKAYKLLETLAFCYDEAADARLQLGEEGCSFAVLENPVGLQMSLSDVEARSLASAAVAFTSGAVISTVAAACAKEGTAFLQIDYWKEGQSAPEARVVEPRAMVVRDGHTYLEAWCHKAQGERLFRLDRIISAHAANLEELGAIGTGKVKVQAVSTPIATISLAPGVPVPPWPKVSKSRKPNADGSATFGTPWLNSPWLPKQLAACGADVIRIEPKALAQAVGDYARSLREPS